MCQDLILKNSIALGTFDGVHLGHAKVLQTALSFNSYNPMVATFAEPPKRSMGLTDVPLLMTAEKKRAVLFDMGFKTQVYLEFQKVRDMEPSGFIDMLIKDYNAAVIVCGFNYRFGKNGSGDIDFLKNYCERLGVKCLACPPVLIDGEVISSTTIRSLIENGEVAKAARYLGRPISFEAVVVTGDKRGRTIQYPTINQFLPDNMVMPKLGVYASYSYVDGKAFKSVTNIGVRPTFLLDKAMSETNIMGLKDNLYGKNIKIELIEFLREEKKFNSLNELKKQINRDSKIAKELLEKLE
ncbi:MAG: bifunctional riboflavin kinase/FAD synthetase [Oscillospiraceae bacterium]|nr:bifunctional riboflavin kinase/FAD synthetase [Oscillospiraceae bacterium]